MRARRRKSLQRLDPRVADRLADRRAARAARQRCLGDRARIDGLHRGARPRSAARAADSCAPRGPSRPRASHSQASSSSAKRSGRRSASQRSSRRSSAAAPNSALRCTLPCSRAISTARRGRRVVDAQPLAHLAHQGDAALLVAQVLRQHLGQASCPCRGRGRGRRSAPRARCRGAPPCRAPSSGARRCRPRGGSRRAAARRTAASTSGSTRASAPQARSTSNMREGLRFHQAARELAPDALGHQRIDLAGIDHLRASAPRSRARR